MSAKKKKGGITRTNKSQQRSTGEQPTKSSIKRKDKGAQSVPEKPKKTVVRRDKNATAKEALKVKKVARRDANATVKEAPKVKKLARRDCNATVKEPVKVKTVKRTDKNKSVGTEQKIKSVKRRDKNETVKQPEKQNFGVARKNKGLQCTEEKVTKGLARKGCTSTSSKETSAFRAKPGTKKSGAFTQSKGETAKPKVVKRTGKANLTSTHLENKPKVSSKRSGGGPAPHTKSNISFGARSTGNSPKPKARVKNTSHMESSILFG